jgi:hypothetical protein
MFLLAFWFLMCRFGLLHSIGRAFGIWTGAVLVVNRIVTMGKFWTLDEL